jgi:hypothetical protein
MFLCLSTPVFLQNMPTDLALDICAKETFPFFAEHVVRRYSAWSGFVTMNLPWLLDVFPMA